MKNEWKETLKNTSILLILEIRDNIGNIKKNQIKIKNTCQGIVNACTFEKLESKWIKRSLLQNGNGNF